MRLVAWRLLVACTSEPASRDQRVIDAIADDNYGWTLREPGLVAMKQRRMQRGRYEWMRGTASLYWRDVMAWRAARGRRVWRPGELARAARRRPASRECSRE